MSVLISSQSVIETLITEDGNSSSRLMSSRFSFVQSKPMDSRISPKAIGTDVSPSFSIRQYKSVPFCLGTLKENIPLLSGAISQLNSPSEGLRSFNDKPFVFPETISPILGPLQFSGRLVNSKVIRANCLLRSIRVYAVSASVLIWQVFAYMQSASFPYVN